MRSNDFNFGLRNDIAYFIYLQKYIADRLGVGYGKYTHYAFSMHMYDRDFKFCKKVAYGDMQSSFCIHTDNTCSSLNQGPVSYDLPQVHYISTHLLILPSL